MRIRWKWKIFLPLFLLLLLIPGSVSDASQKRRTGTGQVVEIPDKWTAFTGNINTHKEPELKILIAGNSLSGLNDMGETLQKLAQAGGHRIQVEVLWKNGCPLYRYASASHTMGKRLRRLLKSQEWDYVILQENTPNVISEDSSVPKAAQRLSKLIRKYGAEPMFLETWAPEEGHKVYKKADYQGISRGQLQRRVKRLFKRLGKTNQASVIWAGEVFWELKDNQKMDLIAADYKHPTAEGSYAMACACYMTLFQEKIPSWNGSVKEEHAKVIRRTAFQMLKNYHF